jgi:hypothetical protein
MPTRTTRGNASGTAQECCNHWTLGVGFPLPWPGTSLLGRAGTDHAGGGRRTFGRRSTSETGRFSLSQSARRGEVFRRHSHYLIAWAYTGTSGVLALHVHAQTGPRHRAEVQITAADCAALGMAAVTSVINTRAPLVDLIGAEYVGELPLRIIDRIATAIRRNAETEAYEATWAGPPWP